MADRIAGLWWYRALFVLIAISVMFVQLLPLHPGPGQLPGPDVMLVLVLSWTIIRPELVPVLLVASVFLVFDLLLMRPPGLWTALTILGCEFLRSRRILLRGASFPVEWLLVACVVTAMTFANAVILALFAVPQPALGLTLIRMLFTIAVYPLILLLAARPFRLRKAKGERDKFGARQ